MPKATERFTTRVDDYARYRPGYPAAAIELLQERCGLSALAGVADVGSGTGILTELLLKSGARVFGVEPNDRMRVVAEAALHGYPRFVSVHGSAEDTTLPVGSVDLVVAGQAFHWFDTARARTEALRIARAGAWGTLLWNERPLEPPAFLVDYEALLHKHAAEYARIAASRADEARMREFFGGAMQLAAYPNHQVLDFEGLKGRLMSSSYAPEPGHAQHEPMMVALRELFDRHARDGTVVFPYRTLVYYGQLKPPA
jgi:SAM-dependent methyltransferase